MTASPPAGKAPYHHGDLRAALVAAATELARQGGPEAIVLRETARRVGVSQTAAYRHFAALPDLVQAVAEVARTGLAAAMVHELARVTAPAGSGEAALARLRAVGHGYVRFALAEPGLYATAFTDGHGKAEDHGEPGGKGDTAGHDAAVDHGEPVDHDAADGPGQSDGSGLEPPPYDERDPYALLQHALGGLIAAGLLDPATREQAAVTAWAAVHGLSLLLLGPMSGIPADTLDGFIDACLRLVAFGLVARDS